MSDQHIREQLVNLLTKPQAHMMFDDAVRDFPLAQINTRPPNVDYTFWHLVEHLRICQWDILDYCRNPNYQFMEWPRGYWPAPESTTDAAGWQHSLNQFRADLRDLVAIVRNPQTDLYAPIPHGYGGHTIFREIMVVASHNAYHIGELTILRGVMNLWEK